MRCKRGVNLVERKHERENWKLLRTVSKLADFEPRGRACHLRLHSCQVRGDLLPSIDIEPSKHGKDAERRFIAILVNRRAK